MPVPDGRVLLVESPAPLDFTRLALTHDAAGATLPPHRVREPRRHAGGAPAPEGPAAVPATGDALEVAENPDLAPELAPRTVGGAPYSLSTRLDFESAS